ncbi:MAG: hypothetical protein QOH93_3305, partial [Chloroflexia bacterium]|nr:hypothetical protein [Chloroflexia bacterium]
MVRGTHEGTTALHIISTSISIAHNRLLDGLRDHFSGSLKSHSSSRLSKEHLLTRRGHRRASLFLVLAVLASVFSGPFSYGRAAQRANAAILSDATTPSTPLPPPASAPVSVVSIAGPEQPAPYLATTTKIAPRTVSIGEVFTATIVVENNSEQAASDLSIDLKLPAGVMKASNPRPGDYTWHEASLEANATLTETATLRLVQPQPGDAIVLRPQIGASNTEVTL